jgi:hypothetical protein
MLLSEGEWGGGVWFLDESVRACSRGAQLTRGMLRGVSNFRKRKSIPLLQ